MSKPIFISYSRQDYEFVERLVDDLTRRGISVWMDQLDIQSGEKWDSAIQQALISCKYFIVVLSPNSVSSENVLDEISFALDEGKELIPVLYSECVIPLRLRRAQYIDFRLDYDNSLRKLTEELRKAFLRSGVSIFAEPAAFLQPDELPSKLFDYLINSNIERTYDLKNLSSAHWRIINSAKVDRQGFIHIEGEGLLNSSREFEAHDGILARFKYDLGTYFIIGIYSDKWDTPRLRKWGVEVREKTKMDIVSGNVRISSSALKGELELLPNRNYSAIMEDGLQE